MTNDAIPRPGPRHVAIIMDGNGRWAATRGLPRLEGHRRGVEAVRRIVEVCPDFGVEYLSLFAFSTENWRRPAAEVKGLMTLFRRYLRRDAAELAEKGARILFLGDRSSLDPDIRALMEGLEARTAQGTRVTVVVALNHGGRQEIVAAAQALARRAAAGELEPSSIDETLFSSALCCADIPDPDLLIRTSGEQRISNFMLWRLAYAELVFAPELWPDFDRDAFARALSSYGARERRFGAVSG